MSNPLISSSPTGIDKLNDDLLSIVFFIVRGPVYPIGHSLKSAILLSIVCRRWRNQALSLARLWNTVHWHPGHGGDQHVGAALAALDRSRNAPLAVQIMLVERPRSDVLLSDLHDGRALLRAVLLPQHLRRITEFSITVSDPFWDDELFRPFSYPGRLCMPALRQLSISFGMRTLRTDLDVNIECSDLEELHVVGMKTRGPGRMVGPSTKLVTLAGGELNLTDVVDVLHHASRLQTFEIGTMLGNLTSIINDINPEDVSSYARRIAGTVANLCNFSVYELSTFHDFATLQLIIYTSSIRRCHVWQSFAESLVAEEAWIEFLNLPSVGEVDELRLLGSRGEDIKFVATKTGWTRHLYSEKATAFACLPLALDSHPPILSTLEVLTFDIIKWTPFMHMVKSRGARMLRLTRIHLIMQQHRLALHQGMRDYTGATIDMPRLECVGFDIGSSTPPSAYLTMRFLVISLQLLDCLIPTPRGGVAFVGGDDVKAALASQCEEISWSVPAEERTVLHEVAAALPPYILGTVENAGDV
ncbi:hypothetical protein EXIGLDRAFT_841358 [Exidia glandulosa HHB12029]|uniref:F-box domain-containing protein n=1 Tax=Exidia glandulosa HHB12029 TaxID=1314781 RepID=A0A165DX37_EXIGL|nr:hypothetical protein EXIGLDRAFT_841358 [Exidia glandulosa HHB12029]